MKSTQVVLIVFILCLCMYIGMCRYEMYSSDRYEKFEDYEFIHNKFTRRGNFDCFENTSREECEKICDAGEAAIGYSHTDSTNMCCVSSGLPNNEYKPGVTSYVKVPPGFKVEKKGARIGGDIKIIPETTLENCAAECKSIDTCVGFTMHSGYCIPKKADGLSSEYVENIHFQYYTKE